MADPDNLKEIGLGVGAFLVAAMGAVKVWKVRIVGPGRNDRLADLSKQIDGRFTEVCKRLDKLDLKYEDTQIMVRTVLTDQADKFGRIETRLEDHGRRLNNLERQ